MKKYILILVLVFIGSNLFGQAINTFPAKTSLNNNFYFLGYDADDNDSVKVIAASVFTPLTLSGNYILPRSTSYGLNLGTLTGSSTYKLNIIGKGYFSDILYLNSSLYFGTSGTARLYESGNNLYFYDATNGAKSLSEILASGSGTVSNGLTKTSNNIKLGGTIIENTTLSSDGYNVKIGDPGNWNFLIIADQDDYSYLKGKNYLYLQGNEWQIIGDSSILQLEEDTIFVRFNNANPARFMYYGDYSDYLINCPQCFPDVDMMTDYVNESITDSTLLAKDGISLNDSTLLFDVIRSDTAININMHSNYDNSVGLFIKNYKQYATGISIYNSSAYDDVTGISLSNASNLGFYMQNFNQGTGFYAINIGGSATGNLMYLGESTNAPGNLLKIDGSEDSTIVNSKGQWTFYDSIFYLAMSIPSDTGWIWVNPTNGAMIVDSLGNAGFALDSYFVIPSIKERLDDKYNGEIAWYWQDEHGIIHKEYNIKGSPGKVIQKLQAGLEIIIRQLYNEKLEKDKQIAELKKQLQKEKLRNDQQQKQIDYLMGKIE